MNHLALVTKREYLNRVKNKAFIVMTFLSPLLMIGISILIGFLSYKSADTDRHINVLDESGLFVDSIESSKRYTFYFLENVNAEEAKKLTQEAELYGLLHIPNTQNLNELSKRIQFFSKDTPSLSVIEKLESVIDSKLNTLKITEEGLDADYLASIKINTDLNLENFEGKESSKFGSGLKLAFGGAAGYLLFMFIIIYGNMIMRSVIEEKSSRIIEVIVSSVSPMKLLLGKVFGTTLAGLTQFLIWIILLFVLGSLSFSLFGVAPTPGAQVANDISQAADLSQAMQIGLNEILALPLLNLTLMFIVFFIGGYLLYASLYAAIGAAVDNDADSQQFMMPIIMPLMISMYVGFFTVMEDPHGMISKVFSYIPLTSPVVMLMRIPYGVPIWAQILSVLILFATFIGVLWFASKIYRVGILLYGKKPSYKDLMKWIKY